MSEERAKVYGDTRRLMAARDHAKIDLVPFPEIKPSDLTPKKEASLARVYEADPLDIAETCAASGYKPLVFVEINENYPERGMAKGGMTGQESELLLRSNYGLCMNDTIYPIKRRFFTYVGKVFIAKSASYKQLSKVFTVPVLGTTVIRSPTVHVRQVDGQGVEHYASPSEETLMRDTIYGAFEMALQKGCDTLIVPALGCEKGHPIDAVIRFFNEAMSFYNVKYVFFGARSYLEDRSRSPLFMKFHHNIHRKYRFDSSAGDNSVEQESEVNSANLDSEVNSASLEDTLGDLTMVNEIIDVNISDEEETPPKPPPEPPKSILKSKGKAKAKAKAKT